MSDKKTPSMRAFFRESLPFVDEPEQVTTPAPPGWVNGDGTPMEFTWRKLTQEENEGLYKAHTKKVWAKGPDGKYMRDSSGAPIQIEERDNFRYLRNAMAESLVFPDMHDRELQLNWGVVNAVDLVGRLFNRRADWAYMTETFNRIQGFGDDAPTVEETFEEIKN